MAGMIGYTGLQGSGKTYEVVKNVILPAIAAGRRVVTNISGLQIPEIYVYCAEKLGSKKLGEVVQVDNNAVSQLDFFPYEKDDPLKAKFPVTIVQGGDLVVLDEVWRWYSSGEVLPPNHLKFFRMHRHFTNADGVTCDVALIVQSIDDLQLKIKRTIEKTFVFEKLKTIGADGSYSINLYAKYKINKASHLDNGLGRYDPAIYSLYKSHSQNKSGAAIELTADRRGNILRSAKFIFGAPILLGVMGLVIWSLWGFFHPPGSKKPVVASTGTSVSASAPGVMSSAPVSSAGQGGRDIDKTGRVIGQYSTHGAVIWLVQDGDLIRRMPAPVATKSTPYGSEIMLPDGRFVSTWWPVVRQEKKGPLQ